MRLSSIKQMEAIARGDSSIVSLSQGVPFYSSAKEIRDYAITQIKKGTVDKYSDPHGIRELRKRICSSIRDESFNYSPEEILVTAGATEGLTATILAMTNPGDEVIIPTPTYTAFFKIAELGRLHVKQVRLNEEESWSLTLSGIKKAITKRTKAILICSPNNPTGTVYSKKVLDEICSLAQMHKLAVILDETYHKMIYDNKLFYSPATQEQFKATVIRVVSFSKDFAITGWRIGYISAKASVIKQILPVHDALVNCAPVISQYAALKALDIQKKVTNSHIKILSQQRSIVESYLEDLSKFLDFSLPSSAYFFFPKLRNIKNDIEFCMDLLYKQKVTLVPGSDFGNGGEGHVRICFGREQESIHAGMMRLSKYMLCL